MHPDQGATVCVRDIELERWLTEGFRITTLVFLGMLALIVTERAPSTTAVLAGYSVLGAEAAAKSYSS
jgi:hypothetical protein